MTSDLRALQERLGHHFADEAVFRRALTHASHTGGQTNMGDYERLEFIGDRVLGLAVADLLYRTYTDENEGALAKRLTALVQQAALVQVAHNIDLSPHVQLSPAERKSGMKDAVLADAVEALMGAIYIDAGYAVAAATVVNLWTPLLSSQTVPPEEAKTRLQEWVQARGLALPHYELIGQEGPPHAPHFTVQVQIDGMEGATATAASKRAAEKAAAALVLARIDHDEAGTK